MCPQLSYQLFSLFIFRVLSTLVLSLYSRIILMWPSLVVDRGQTQPIEIVFHQYKLSHGLDYSTVQQVPAETTCISEAHLLLRY